MPLHEIEAERWLRQVGEIINFVRDDDWSVNLSPPYQRGDVWPVEKKRNLWKSLLMGIPVPAIFVNRRGNDYTDYYVVDGQQRLRALVGFRQGEFGLPLDWLAEDMVENPAPFVCWDDLTDIGRRRLRMGLSPIPWLETTLETEADEAALYLLVNYGGVEQTAEDRARAEAVAFSQEK